MTNDEYRSYPCLCNSDLTELKRQLDFNFDKLYGDYLKLGNDVDDLITMQREKSEVPLANEMKSAFKKNCPPSIYNLIYSERTQFQKIDINHTKFDEDIIIESKCKHDIFVSKISIDYKTTQCTSKKAFVDSIYYFDYDRQSWFYNKVGKCVGNYIIGQSKKYPYEVWVIDPFINFEETKTKTLSLIKKFKDLYL